MVANAAAVEDGIDDLRIFIHMSGVSAGGDLRWASVYGQGPYVDPDVLRVFGQAHTFCRRLDILSSNRLTTDTRAWPVGTLHRGGRRVVATPSSSTPLSALAEDEEHLEVFTRAFQNPGFSAESGIYPDISGYIRWNLLAIQCESKTEDTAGTLTTCSGSSWKD